VSIQLVFHKDVEFDVQEAYRWYEKHQPGLGEAFLSAIEEVFDRLRRFPQVHQRFWNDVRRARPKRFPYAVYYRMQQNRVEVIAVQHRRRDPNEWQSRFSDN
jgi:toxin ParE1/3/4